MRFPTNTYLCERIFRRKQFQPNVNAISLIVYVVTSFRTALFLKMLLLHIFFRVSTSTQQLLFRSSYFVKSSYLFQGIPFPEQSPLRVSYFVQNSYFFRVKLVPSSQFLRLFSSFGQLIFWWNNLLNKDTCRTATYLKQVLLNSNNFFRADTL